MIENDVDDEDANDIYQAHQQASHLITENNRQRRKKRQLPNNGLDGQKDKMTN